MTSVEEAVRVVEAGAHRLEVCVSLEEGGVTPPPALLRSVRAAVSVPVFAMARPRPGAFVFDPAEIQETLEQIESLLAQGADGVVVGFLRPDGGIDEEATARAVELAGPAPVTFHRAFDETADLAGGLERLRALGVRRVLTGGGPGAARLNADALARLIGGAPEGVEVMVGGGVRGDHVRHLVAYTGAREVHARAEGVAGICRALGNS